MEKDLYLYIAGFLIGICFSPTEPPYLIERNFRSRLETEFKGFLIDEFNQKKIDFWININFQNEFEVIVKLKKKYTYINFYRENGSKIDTFYHISIDQFKVILRNILQKLLTKNGGLIMHASASLVNDSACIFFGESGAGKSTIAQLICEKFKPLADDNIIIKKAGNKFNFYQTPFIEKNTEITKITDPIRLGNLYFLKKSNQNKVSQIQDSQKKVKLLIKQFLTEKSDFSYQMASLLKLASFANFYTLEFSLKNKSELINILQCLKSTF